MTTLCGRALWLLALFCFISLIATAEKEQKESEKKEKPQWAKKDVRDYTDADLERLYDQWEENDDEPLDEDELPEHRRDPPKINPQLFNTQDPESILKMSKKGRTLMSFVTVSGNPTRKETEEITAMWQTGLMNSHIIAERYLVDDNRAIFMFKDGSQAWEAKDFLVEQPRMKEVMIENKAYPGKHFEQKQEL